MYLYARSRPATEEESLYLRSDYILSLTDLETGASQHVGLAADFITDWGWLAVDLAVQEFERSLERVQDDRDGCP